MKPGNIARMRQYPVLLFYFILFSFLVFGVWEWLQTPFFTDISTDINEIVSFRLHCTLNDILIIGGSVVLVSLVKRGPRWMLAPDVRDYLFVTILGVGYTLISEHLNVYVWRRWGYSEWMPIIPLVGAGLVPVLQWLLLPSIILLLTKDHVRRFREPANRGKSLFDIPDPTE